MKKYLYGFLAIALAFGLSAFTIKKVSKPFATVKYYYKSTANLTSGFPTHFRMDMSTNSGNVYVRSIDKPSPLQFTDCSASGPWATSSWSFTSVSSGTQYVGSIEFDEEATADGDDDGQLTLCEAVGFLYQDFKSTSSLPAGTHCFDANGNGQFACVIVDNASTIHP